jgi:CSLREA domain-containing protein
MKENLQAAGIFLVFFIAGTFLFGANTAGAATLFVNTTGDEDADNSTCSLREAVIAANTNANYNGCVGSATPFLNNTIMVLDGTYTLEIAGTGEDASLTGDLDIDGNGGNLTINGGSEQGTIIQAGTTPLNGIDRVLDVRNGANVVLTNLTVRHGRISSWNGGGILIRDGNLVTDMVTITQNTAIGQSGGGIFKSTPGGGLTITNSTISNNTTTGGTNGGGIYSDNSNLLIDNSAMTGNTAGDEGGGIYRTGTSAALTITNSTVSNNTATGGLGGGFYSTAPTILDNVTMDSNTCGSRGGAIYKSGDTTLTITNSVLSSNSAPNSSDGLGGAIFTGSETQISTVTVRNNTAGESGGGIFKQGNNDLRIYWSTFNGNQAWRFDGGAIWNGSVNTYLTNVTISGNSTVGNGGGIYNSTGTTNLLHVTISNNSAGSGGGINRIGGTVRLQNTIVANSPSGGNCAGTITSDDYNIDSDGTCSLAGLNDLVADPRLAPLSNWGGPTQTQPLYPESPAIDSGVASAATDDQRGVARPQDYDGDTLAVEDRGAVEMLQNESLPTMTQWGMIIFSVIAGGAALHALRKQRHAAA